MTPRWTPGSEDELVAWTEGYLAGWRRAVDGRRTRPVARRMRRWRVERRRTS